MHPKTNKNYVYAVLKNSTAQLLQATWKIEVVFDSKKNCGCLPFLKQLRLSFIKKKLG
jgi:hypothetical protein